MEKFEDIKLKKYIRVGYMLLEHFRSLPMTARDSLFDRFLEKFMYLVLRRIASEDFTEEQAEDFIKILEASFALNQEDAIVLFVHNYYNYLMNMCFGSEPQKILNLMYECKSGAESFLEVVKTLTEDEAIEVIQSYNLIKVDEKEIPSDK